MTPAEVRSALGRLGLSQVGLARILRVSPQTVRRWVADPDSPSAAPIPAWAVAVLEWIEQPGRPAEWPEQNETGTGKVKPQVKPGQPHDG